MTEDATILLEKIDELLENEFGIQSIASKETVFGQFGDSIQIWTVHFHKNKAKKLFEKVLNRLSITDKSNIFENFGKFFIESDRKLILKLDKFAFFEVENPIRLSETSDIIRMEIKFTTYNKNEIDDIKTELSKFLR